MRDASKYKPYSEVKTDKYKDKTKDEPKVIDKAGTINKEVIERRKQNAINALLALKAEKEQQKTE